MNYSHKHHIIPKHEWKKRFGNLKGVNDPDNIVFLSVEQHTEVHKWLWEHTKSEGDKFAYLCLGGRIGKDMIMRERSKLGGSWHKGKHRSMSIEHRKAISESKKGKKLSEEHRHTLSIVRMGNKNGCGGKGKKKPAVGLALRGRKRPKFSEEWCKNISLSKSRKNQYESL